MAERLSIRDLARKIGVSHSTVSLSLRNDPRIPAPTRRKVVRAAADLGYRRDAVLGELMAQLRNLRKHENHASLGFVTAWPTRDGWKKAANHTRFFTGVKQRAQQQGYRIDEFWLSEPGMTPARMTAILRARGIRGLVLHSLPEPRGELHLEWRHFACVTKGLTLAKPTVHRVISSHYDDMQLAIRRVCQRRYRRLGLVLGQSHDLRVGRAWLAAFVLYQRELSGSVVVPPLLLDRPDPATFRQWYERQRPDAILYADQPVRAWLTDLAVQIPQEVGLANLDWSPDETSMAGIDSDPESLGAAAIDLLVGQLQAHEYGVPQREKIVEVKGRWVAGATLR